MGHPYSGEKSLERAVAPLESIHHLPQGRFDIAIECRVFQFVVQVLGYPYCRHGINPDGPQPL